MIIKKFVAKTEAEAIENAKKELGNDVVVMNVKEVKPSGIFAFLKPKLVEVTVALEDEKERFSPLRKERETVSRNNNTSVNNASTNNSSVNHVTNLTEKMLENTTSIEEKLENLQNLLVSKLQSAENVASTQNVQGATEAAEKQEEKAEEASQKDDEYLKFLKLLYNMMIENEVDERYANQVIDGLDKGYKPNQSFDHMLASVYQRLILKFGKTEKIEPAKEGPRVVVFIGPTGVGKTTTIAKIASQFAIEQKKQVALLTADTYRIAAAEQLRTYANIMQVPFRVIYGEEEMVTAIKDFYNYDYIFVDTLGHSHRNEEQKDNTKQLLESLEGIAETQRFLVLSATTKYKDLLKIADNYKEITDFHLIFTKLDETYTVGNLLNLRFYTNAAISYVTYGQNVPDDIELFDPQKTVKLLLGGKSQ